MTEQIKKGDVVILKSGSIKMTVSAVDGDYAYCVYYDFAIHQFNPHNFRVPVETLQKV
jgi:uncharacterized protein YodC (DUF2158 family)